MFEKISNWLETDEAVLTIIGSPGSGKTAIAAKLLQLSRESKTSDFAGFLSAWVFAEDDRFRDVRKFCESVLLQLASRHLPIAEQLRELADSGDVHLRVERVTAGQGGQKHSYDVINSISFVNFNAITTLSETIARSLEELSVGSARPVIMIDGLDESSEVMSLVTKQLIPTLGVRWVIITRPDHRATDMLSGQRINLDLETVAEEDVQDFLRVRASAIAISPSEAAIEAITEASHGNLMFADLAFQAVLQHAESIDSVDKFLSGVVNDTSLKSYYEIQLLKWHTSLREDEQAHIRFISVLTVAKAPLTPLQIAGILNAPLSEVSAIIRAWFRFPVNR